ncbi:MAG: DUF4906 domain-containing protein, partial [Alistipes communis]
PYFSYRRSAKVKLTVQLEGHPEPTVDTVTIFQVRRIINPKGIYRRHDNDTPFNVVLTHRKNEAATQYPPFESEGPWEAEIETGSDWIRINGVLGGRGQRATGSEIVLLPAGRHHRRGSMQVRDHSDTLPQLLLLPPDLRPSGLRSRPVAGDAKWHCFNLCYNDTEAKSPARGRSLFRFGNFDPIDATNSVFDNFRTMRRPSSIWLP